MSTESEHTDYSGLGGRVGSAKGSGNISGRLGHLAAITPLRGNTLMDIGCGNGAYTMVLARGFRRTVALDIEPDRLGDFRDACSEPSIEIRMQSATDTGEPTASIDMVTAIEVMEHLGSATPEVVAEVRRILVPGGHFLITTPNRWWPLEQHGWVARGRRRPGWQFPFLTWVPRVHRRFSPDAVFTPDQLDRIVGHGFRRVGLRYMMPPLDGSPRLQSRLSGPFAAIERSPLQRAAQTIVIGYERVP